jgi:hypothetical protein
MTEDHGTFYIIAEFLFSIIIVLGLSTGIVYIAVILKELIKGTFGKD